MKGIKIIGGFALAVAIVSLVVVSLRRHPPSYDFATETTVRGVVQEVQEFNCPVSGNLGTHLIVQTANGPIQVHVAPERFLRGNGLSFAKGDQVEIVGARFNYKGADTLIARKISRGNETFAFRKTSGKPVWTE